MKTQTTHPEGRTPQVAPAAKLDRVSCIQDLIEACDTLGLKLSRKQVQDWLSTPFSDCFEALEVLHAETGDRFLGALAFDVRWYCEEKQSVPGHETAVVDYIMSKVGARTAVACARRYAHIHQEGFESRRTEMNTTLDRSMALGFPVFRFLQSRTFKDEVTIVDIGVGYPPLTTIETAKTASRLNIAAKVIGVDVTVPDAVVQVPDGDHHYLAFYNFDADRTMLTPAAILKATGERSGILLYEKPAGLELEYGLRKAEAVRKRLAATLLEKGNGPEFSAEQFEEICNSGGKLRRGKESLTLSPMQSYGRSTPNLEFRRDDFRLQTVQEADVIRVANVLRDPYYNAEETREALRHISAKLREGGLLVIALDDNFSFSYQKQRGKLVPQSATLLLRNRFVVRAPVAQFPQFNGVFKNVMRFTSGMGDQEPRLHEKPVSRQEAERVAKLFQETGHSTRVTLESNATWLDVELLAARRRP